MAGPIASRLDLSQIIGLFPRDSLLIRRLMLRDETFRSICEEYQLARASLSWFEALPDAEHRPEVAEYRSLVPSLESEIEQFLRKARQ